MSDYIDRKELIENLNTFAPEHYNALINMLIEKQPSVDVVKVVRCKECKLRDTEDCFVAFWDCGELMCYAEDNDFCSYGERKEKCE